MTNYYVRKSGSDSNNGLTTATAWLTIGKALGASGIASGDTVYVGAGIYRETPTVTISPSATTSVIGDVTGQYTGDAGEVRLTAYTTSDVAAPSGSALLAPSARRYFVWKCFTFAQGANNLITFGTSRDWTFEDCTFLGRIAGGSAMFTHTTTAGQASNLIFRRCRAILFSNTNIMSVQSALHTSDYDANIRWERCVLIANGSDGVNMTGTTGAGSGKPYGLKFHGNLIMGGNTVVVVNTAAHATTGSEFYDNMVWMLSASAVLNGSTASQIAANYNRILNGSTYTNITSGAQDDRTSNRAYTPDFGQGLLWGYLRPYATPEHGDPHLQMSAQSGMPAFDALNRIPNGDSQHASNHAVGHLARHDIGIKGTVVPADSGNNIEITGPGDHDFDVPVDAKTVTLSIKVRVSGYGGTTYPTMQILGGAYIGVADASSSATIACTSRYETIGLTCTPNAKGVVTVRLTNLTNNGTGVAAFDTFRAV